MTVVENKAVISSFVEEVLNQGRLKRVDDLVAVDFVEVDPLPGQQQGREGLKQVISAFRTAFPDIHWVIEKMVGEGEKVSFRRTSRAGGWSRKSGRASGPAQAIFAIAQLTTPKTLAPLAPCSDWALSSRI